MLKGFGTQPSLAKRSPRWQHGLAFLFCCTNTHTLTILWFLFLRGTLTVEELAWCHQWKLSASPQSLPWLCDLQAQKQHVDDYECRSNAVWNKLCTCISAFTKAFLLDHTTSGIKSICCFSQFSHSNIFLNKKRKQHMVRMATCLNLWNLQIYSHKHDNLQ